MVYSHPDISLSSSGCFHDADDPLPEGVTSDMVTYPFGADDRDYVIESRELFVPPEGHIWLETAKWPGRYYLIAEFSSYGRDNIPLDQFSARAVVIS